MKTSGIINSHISRVLSYMGHTDTICIGDCGLPVPDSVERIDLSLRLGYPGFMEVLNEVSKDMEIEKIFLAEEIIECNPLILSEIKSLFPQIETGFVSHTKLKKMTRRCKAVVRTGENTPYANIILQSGCIFK